MALPAAARAQDRCQRARWQSLRHVSQRRAGSRVPRAARLRRRWPRVSALELQYWVRGENIRPGDKPDEWPRIVVTFYDERRATVGEESVGRSPARSPGGRKPRKLRVPLRAREAILRIGLLGAVGELSLDDFGCKWPRQNDLASVIRAVAASKSGPRDDLLASPTARLLARSGLNLEGLQPCTATLSYEVG